MYTIYPPDVVLQVQAEEKRDYFNVEVGGRTLVLEFRDGQARVVRLISPDPMDYLKPQYQPGEAFHFPCLK
ncbi:MAG TPA: hypothetical protein GXX23_09090 [Firmicutes bacterium]|nr:hypothetical protein [Candidatus Fermentithermobacillaceae bacterium]